MNKYHFIILLALLYLGLLLHLIFIGLDVKTLNMKVDKLLKNKPTTIVTVKNICQ